MNDAQKSVALYYPHTRVHSLELLKAALLLWDQIECIVPGGFASAPDTEVRELKEAAELVVQERVPSTDEKLAVHRRIEVLLKDGVPSWFHSRIDKPDERFYLVYPDKLLHETWRLLESMSVATLVGHGGRDYQVPPALGLLLMSMLADECAGATRLKVTDRTDAYTWLMGALTADLGGEYLPNMNAGHFASSFDRLLSIRVRTIRPDDIPLHQLIALRRREAAESSGDLRRLRWHYAAETTAFVRRLTAPGLSAADQSELERQYHLRMEDDLRDLKRELGLAATKSLLSKEVALAVIAAAGVVFGTGFVDAGGLVLGVGALVKTGVDHSEARRKALLAHPMSWLYLA